MSFPFISYSIWIYTDPYGLKNCKICCIRDEPFLESEETPQTKRIQVVPPVEDEILLKSATQLAKEIREKKACVSRFPR